MFGSIRDRIQNLQDNLTITLRGLSVGHHSSDASPGRKEPSSTVSLNAGTYLLEKFQSSWSELHEVSQENATKAQEVDDLILKLHKSADNRWKGISHLTGMLSYLPELIESVNTLHGKTVNLGDLLKEVELGLVALEDVEDEKAFEDKVIDEKFKLALHEQTRLAQLGSLRTFLEEKHREKMKVEGGKKQFYFKDELGIDYNEAIKSFKEPIPRIKLENEESVKSLADVILDSENNQDLEEFLEEKGPEENKNSS